MALDDLPSITDYLPKFSVGEIKKPAPKKSSEPVDYYGKLSPKQRAEVDKEIELQNNPRGALGEIGTGLVRGAAYELPRMVGQALKATGKEGDTLYDAGQGLNNLVENNSTRFMLDPNEQAHNAVTRAFAEGASMLAPSVAPLALAAIPGVGLGAGAALAGAGGGALFGSAQYQDTYEKAKKAGKSDAEAHTLGLQTGVVEAGGEAIGGAVGGAFVRGAGGLLRRVLGRKVGADEAIDAIRNPKFLTEFAKDFTAVAGVNAATEAGQGAGQAAIERGAGIDDTDPYEAATAAIGPALAMSVFLGPVGGIAMKRQQNRNKGLLSTVDNLDAPMHEVNDAAREIGAQIEPLVGKEEAMNWRLDALVAANAKAAERSAIEDQQSMQDVAAGRTSTPIAPGQLPTLEADLLAEIGTHEDLIRLGRTPEVEQPTSPRYRGMPQFGQDDALQNVLSPAEKLLAERAFLGGDIDRSIDLRDDLESELSSHYFDQIRAQQHRAILQPSPGAPRLPAPAPAKPAAPMTAQERARLDRAQKEQDKWQNFQDEKAKYEARIKAGEQPTEAAPEAPKASIQDEWRAAATDAGLDVSKLRGQNLARVTQALKAADGKPDALEQLKAARDKMTENSVMRDSLDAYITSKENTNGAAQTASQDPARTEPQGDAVQAPAAATGGNQADDQGDEAAQRPVQKEGVTPRIVRGTASAFRPENMISDTKEGSDYTFPLHRYNPKRSVNHPTNSLILESYRKALNDAEMVDDKGKPKRKTQAAVAAQRRAREAFDALSAREGAQIHEFMAQRLAELRGDGTVSDGVQQARGTKAATTRDTLRDEIAAEALARAGVKPTKKAIEAYKLTDSDKQELAHREEITLENDPEADFFAAEEPAYKLDNGLLKQIESGDMKQVLGYLKTNGPTEWVRYIAGVLDELNLSTSIEFVPKVARGPASRGSDQSAVGARVLGRYHHDSNVVRIYLGGADAHTVVHEIVHAATVGRLAEGVAAGKIAPTKRSAAQRAAYADMLELYEFYREIRPALKGKYAFTNIKEFVAEAFSNEELQQWLAKREYDGRSVWSRLVDWVMDALGIRRTPQSRSALEKALSSGYKMFGDSRFGSESRMSFAHSPGEAMQAVNSTGQALVSSFNAALDRAGADLPGWAARIKNGILRAATTHHMESWIDKTPELATMQPSIQGIRTADSTKTAMLDSLHHEILGRIKPIERIMAGYTVKQQRALDAKIGELVGQASQYNVDLRKNFDANMADNPKLNPRLRQTINNMHAQYMELPQQLRQALETAQRGTRKMYVQQVATFLANRVRQYAPQLGDAAGEISRRLDIRDPSLKEGTNINPDKFTDVETSNLDFRIRKVFEELGGTNPKASVAEGGTTLGTELAEMAKLYAQQRDNPYQHLGRSGDYFVSFRVPENLQNYDQVQAALEPFGKVISIPAGGNRNVFMRFDKKAQADAARAAVARLGESIEQDTLSSGSIGDRGSAESMRGVAEFARNILREIDNQDFPDDVNGEISRFMKRQVMEMFPDTSSQKALIQRKEGGTAGYDASFMRSYGTRADMAASMLANSYTLPLHDAAFNSMREQVRDLEKGQAGTAAKGVYDEFRRRFSNSLNPVESPLIDLYKSGGYNFYLAMNPAYLLTNMLQPIQLTAPYLGARFGFVPAVKEMKSSTGKAVDVLRKTLAQGIKEGKDAGGTKGAVLGALDLDYVLDKSGLSQGEQDFIRSLQASGELSAMQSVEIGQIASGTSRARATTMKLLSAGSQYTEVVNRISSGLAGYNLAKKRGASDAAATQQGIRAVQDTQFNYSDRNTASAFGRHGVFGKVTPLITSFMNYNFQTIELLLRESRAAISKNSTPEERKEALKSLGGIMTTTTLLAGALGLPAANAIAAIADGIMNAAGGDDDDPSDVKASFRRWLADVFGKDVAEGIARGLPRAVLGVDLSTRTGLQDIIPGTRFMADRREWKDKFESGALDSLGPATSATKDVILGMSQVMDGRVLDGLVSMLPSALRGTARAVRQAQDGFTNAAGNKLPMEVTSWDQAVTALGFTPGKKAEQSEVNAAFKQSDMQLRARQAKLSNRLYRAIERGEDTADIVTDVMEFNRAHPQYKIDPKRALETRAKARGVAEVSGTDITTLPRFLPLLEKYRYANTQ